MYLKVPFPKELCRMQYKKYKACLQRLRVMKIQEDAQEHGKSSWFEKLQKKMEALEEEVDENGA